MKPSLRGACSAAGLVYGALSSSSSLYARHSPRNYAHFSKYVFVRDIIFAVAAPRTFVSSLSLSLPPAPSPPSPPSLPLSLPWSVRYGRIILSFIFVSLSGSTQRHNDTTAQRCFQTPFQDTFHDTFSRHLFKTPFKTPYQYTFSVHLFKTFFQRHISRHLSKTPFRWRRFVQTDALCPLPFTLCRRTYQFLFTVRTKQSTMSRYGISC